MGSAKCQAGLTKLELSVVVAVIALAWIAAFDRLRDLQEMGEKTAVEMTVSNIRSGLRFEMAERIMSGREGSIGELADSNPVRWLDKLPEAYLGEFPMVPPSFPPGSWYFDTGHKELHYRPALGRYLECEQCERVQGNATLVWHITLAGNPMFGRGDTVRVVAVAPYRWF